MNRKILWTPLAVTLMIAPAWAGRPLAIDDADPVDTGQFEFEAGAGYVCEPGCDHWDFPFGLTYGVFPRVEAGLGFGGQFEERAEILDAAGTEEQVSEVFAEKELADGAETVGQFNLGLRYCPADSLTLDLAAGSRIGDEGPDFTATAGLTWAFGSN